MAQSPLYCPRHGKPASAKDPFGKPLVCKCGISVKLVDEGSVILSLIYACTHTGVQTKCGYCTAYIQKCHFVWSFHLGQFSLPTSSWPLVLQFSLPTSGWPLVLQASLPTSGWPLVLQFSLLPRCSHLLHPPHSSSCKTLLLWTSHSSCGRPNFLVPTSSVARMHPPVADPSSSSSLVAPTVTISLSRASTRATTTGLQVYFVHGVCLMYRFLFTLLQSLMSRHPAGYSLCLPQEWRQTISPGDMGWIGRSLFVAKGKMTSQLKLWWYPPAYEAPTGKPSPAAYHRRRLFLWMPRKMWHINFRCCHCSTPQSLHSKAIYRHVL